jgi:uncharacterized membrane protein YphA (DoxX/SURF4 family)
MKEINQTKDLWPDKAKNIALWALQTLTAVVFLMAGFAKLSGQHMMVEMFDKVGFGQWFRYLTGSIEMVSAIMLFVPKLTPVGAGLLVCAMSCAAITHLVKIGGTPDQALVLGLFTAIILWGRFGSSLAFLGKPSTQAIPATKPVRE